MPSHTIASHPRPPSKKQAKWVKVKRTIGLYLYRPSGVYHARVCAGNKLYRESLRTHDLAFAKRKLQDCKQRLQRTDPRYGKVSLLEWLEKVYSPTLRGSEGGRKAKRRIIERVKRTWRFARTQPMRDLKPSEVERWLNEQFG